jgi:hypothetical protein
MHNHWKRYLLLAALSAILAYISWRVYEDYQLSSVPRQMADRIPVPPGVKFIEQREVANKTCRSAGIVKYYATDLSWDQVLLFYNGYLRESTWQPWIGESTYTLNQNPRNQVISLAFSQIKKATNDIERRALSGGKTAYLVQVGYGQDIKAADTYCKPED